MYNIWAGDFREAISTEIEGLPANVDSQAQISKTLTPRDLENEVTTPKS